MCKGVVFTVLTICGVILAYTENTDSKKLTREKRYDDNWNWGYVDIVEGPNTYYDSKNWGYVDVVEGPDTRIATDDRRKELNVQTTTEEPNPCLKKISSDVPDFSAPGRRVSEKKCYEYMWQLKNRDDIRRKSKACLDYTLKNCGQNCPHFAIGGRNTTPGEFPHMAAVGWKAAVGSWVFLCGSSLISPKFVLTAAHCSRVSRRDTSVADPVPKIVRLGDKNIIDIFYNSELPYDLNITRIIVHPRYASPKKYYDIALMELEFEATFSKLVQPVCLWTHFDTSSLGTQATLTGWGVIETAGRTTSPELQAADVDIIDSGYCDQLLLSYHNRLWWGIQEHQLCAGKLVGGVDACQGDSGGPLQVKIPIPITTEGSLHYIIGVTSFGIKCARADTPGIYTRVSSFIDWIESIVWP